MGFSFKKIWFNNTNLWLTVFILIILYAVSSVNVLMLVINVLPHLPGAFIRTNILVYFAEISFGLGAFVSIYHLSTMFRRKKRKTDK